MAFVLYACEEAVAPAHFRRRDGRTVHPNVLDHTTAREMSLLQRYSQARLYTVILKVMDALGTTAAGQEELDKPVYAHLRATAAKVANGHLEEDDEMRAALYTVRLVLERFQLWRCLSYSDYRCFPGPTFSPSWYDD